MEFRDVTALLHGAAADIRTVSIAEHRVVLNAMTDAGEHVIVFSDVDVLRCRMAGDSSAGTSLQTVGLEKLGSGEVWRLYAGTSGGAELELSCASIACDGAEVTGVGRSYRH